MERRKNGSWSAHPDITGAQLYAEVVPLAQAAGWTFGGPHSGHLVEVHLVDHDREIGGFFEQLLTLRP